MEPDPDPETVTETPKAPTKPKEAPKPPQNVQWIACRAKKGLLCPGNQATVIKLRTIAPQEGGGTVYRYKCLTCRGAWHLRV